MSNSVCTDSRHWRYSSFSWVSGVWVSLWAGIGDSVSGRVRSGHEQRAGYLTQTLSMCRNTALAWTRVTAAAFAARSSETATLSTVSKVAMVVKRKKKGYFSKEKIRKNNS